MTKRERALKIIAEMYGEEEICKFIDAVSPLGDDLSKLSLEWVFADVHANSSLSHKVKELLNIAALISRGDAAPQLKNHIKMALKVGCSEKEIHDVLMQMLLINGLPSVVNAKLILNEALIEHNEQ